jgi:hypothetical protein
MNRIALLAAGCATLALAGCDHPDAARQREARALKVISKLDCPETQGHLKRVSVAPDGLSCAYGADGVEVTLKLVSLVGGDAVKGLEPVEAELRALMPAKAADPAASSDQEEVDIDVPGVKIKAGDAGAQIRVGGATIDANDDNAEIRVQHNVTVDGKRVETSSRRHRGDDGVYSQLILANDKPAPSGWSVVGYEARGPLSGPLVVATLKAKRSEHSDSNSFKDVDALVRHNVGGRRKHGITIGAD